MEVRMDMINKKKSAWPGGLLNYYNPIFSTSSDFPQVAYFRKIGYLAMKVIEDVMIINLNNDEGKPDDK